MTQAMDATQRDHTGLKWRNPCRSSQNPSAIFGRPPGATDRWFPLGGRVVQVGAVPGLRRSPGSLGPSERRGRGPCPLRIRDSRARAVPTPLGRRSDLDGGSWVHGAPASRGSLGGLSPCSCWGTDVRLRPTAQPLSRLRATAVL